MSTSPHYKKAVFVLLVAATVVCLSLLGLRFIHTGTQHYRFLVWNLFLAWIPFGLAALASAFAATRSKIAYAIIVPTTVLWLLFFPNAPYILTDFLHLDAYKDNVPQWYDLMLLLWFAWTGLLLGIASLRLMHEIARRALGVTAGWVFVAVATALGSLGIYLGRFLRWNSWDVLHAPLSLADQVWQRVSQPLANTKLVGFTGVFALFFLFVYLAVYVLGGLGREDEPPAFARGDGDTRGEDAPVDAQDDRDMRVADRPEDAQDSD